MSMLASVLLILFTLEIIFIFIYMPSTVQYVDDDKPNVTNSVGPPQFPPPVPPIYTNAGDYEFDGEFGGPGRGPGRRPGRRPGRHPRRRDDSDSDSDSDDDGGGGNRKNKEISGIHFFTGEEKKHNVNWKEVSITPKFDHTKPKQKYTLTIDPSVSDEHFLIVEYKNIHINVKYKLLGDGKVIEKDRGSGGTIILGKIKKFTKNYKDLEFTIKSKQ